MLRRDEWAWWPLAPWLAWQGWRAIRTVPRLPPPREPGGRIDGHGSLFRLLGLGDSTIAGVGCDSHAHALTGAVAARLAARSGRAVEWHARGVSGATAADVRRAMLPGALAWGAHAVVLSVGVNDAVRGRRPDEFADDLRAIAEAFASARPALHLVYAGMPPIGSAPALSPPLSTLLARRARGLRDAADEALSGHAQVVRFPDALAADAFCSDGFHPGEAGCAAWSAWVAARLAD
jgi:lysophospholipase L1-like esterase